MPRDRHSSPPFANGSGTFANAATPRSGEAALRHDLDLHLDEVGRRLGRALLGDHGDGLRRTGRHAQPASDTARGVDLVDVVALDDRLDLAALQAGAAALALVGVDRGLEGRQGVVSRARVRLAVSYTHLTLPTNREVYVSWARRCV